MANQASLAHCNKVHYIQQIHSLFQLHKIEIDYEMYICDGSHGCITTFGFLKKFAPLYNMFVQSKQQETADLSKGFQ